MATTLSPEQEENKSHIPQDDRPDYLKKREGLENPDNRGNQSTYGANDQRGSAPQSPENLNQFELSAGNPTRHENRVGEGYKSPNAYKDLQPSSKGVWVFARKNRGKLIIGGSIAGFLTLLIVGFLILIPFKLLHIVNNIQDHFFATPNDATERMVERSFQTYLQKHVLPVVRTCGSTIHPGCRVIVPAGGNPVTALFRGWSQARFEQKLATKYGVIFGFDSQRGIYYLDVKGKGKIDITQFREGRINDIFDSPGFRSSNEFRNAYKQAIKTATADETRFKRTYIRFKANRLARLKTGLPACVFLCAPRDNFRDWKADQKKKAYRLARVSRIMAPRDEITRLVIECLFDRSCDLNVKTGLPPDVNANNGRISNSPEGGKPTSGFETKLRSTLLSMNIGGLTGKQKLEKAQLELDEREKSKTWTRYVAAKVVAEALVKSGIAKGEREAREAARRITAAIPYVGWILFLASLTETVDYVIENGEQVGYLVNSTTMMAEWQSLVTLVHECKEGRCDAAALGSAVEMLEPCLESTDPCDVGGTAGAEQSPVYGEILGSKGVTSTTTAFIPNFFGTARAQEPNYTCGENENPQPLEAGKLACPEERLDQETDAGQIRDAIKKIPGYEIVTALGGAWNDVIGGITGLICKVPFLCEAVNALFSRILSIPGISHITDFMGEMFNKYFLPKNPSGLKPSGGRQLQLAAGGASKLASDLAHNNLGGSKLEQPQVNRIVRYQQEQKLAEYRSKSFVTRMFDSESPHSPVSRFAMAMPTSFSSAINRATAFLANNPFSSMLNTFAAVPAFAGLNDKASAARDLKENPWGITQYGYLPSNPIFQEDPEKYYQDNCMTNAKTVAWNERARLSQNSITKEPENLFDPNDKYHGTNPCLLIWASVGSAGAIYTDEVLSPEEVNEPTAGGGGGGGTLDCANAPDRATWADQSAGDPQYHRDAIAQYAEGRDCTDEELAHTGFTTPSNAVPNDGLRQYFASYALTGDPPVPVPCEQLPDGNRYPGRICIGVKYRNPYGGGNTIPVPIDGGGGSTPPPNPSPGPSPPPPPCRNCE